MVIEHQVTLPLASTLSLDSQVDDWGGFAFTMFPPVDDQVLRDNPEFAKLYSMLKTDILNPDGSTKLRPDDREREIVSRELKKIRGHCAKQYLLERAIAAASLPDKTTTTTRSTTTKANAAALSNPPDAIADLLFILPSLVKSDQCLEPTAAALILSSPPFSEFESLLPELGEVISANLHDSALSLARITHPSTNPSYLNRHISSLPADHAALRNQVLEAQLNLMSSRVRALASLTELLRSYTESFTLLIRSLEAKHGVAARSLELRSADVSLEAQRTELDSNAVSTNLGKDMYSPEAVTALGQYLSHLKDAQLRAAERVRGLQAELGEYGVGMHQDGSKEKTMKEMARVYHEMESQMEDVTRDLARLDSRT